MKTQSKEILWIVTAIVLLLFLFFPIYWMIISSLRPNIEIFQFPPTLVPKKLTTEAYRILFAEPRVIRSLLNTILVSAGTTLLSLSIATLGAFGISRFSFFGKKPLQMYILTTQMLPVILLSIPFFTIFTKLGLYDTRIGLVIAYTSFTIPFCALTMVGFYNSIPISLEESALIDGCTRFGAFLRIVFPLSRPGFVATGFFAFVTAWNEYLLPVVLTSSEKSQMLVVEIGYKIGQYDIKWNELMALSVVSSIPLIIIYAFLQRAFVRGMTAGAVKM